MRNDDGKRMNINRVGRAAGAFIARETVRALGRFGTVGVLNTLVDLTAFAILRGWLGLPTLIANTLSYSAGIVNSYIWNRRWTFARRPRRAIGAQFPRFAAVSVSALVLNDVLVLSLAPVLETWLAHPGLALAAAKICATGASLVWNFTLNNRWTFRQTPGGGP